MFRIFHSFLAYLNAYHFKIRHAFADGYADSTDAATQVKDYIAVLYGIDDLCI